MKIGIITLGCKVNHYESDSMEQQLKKEGYEVTQRMEPCDAYILNTCAVTGIAERKSREFIARILKQNENAKIFVCGCASEHNSEQFLKYGNVQAVIGNSGKNKITNILKQIGNLKTAMTLQYETMMPIKTNQGRAYLKIQDGCNNFCSYCLIPYVRGRSRSRDLNEIVNEATDLAKYNSEIVLTGINMSDYRINGKLALPELLKSLSGINCRFRISSLEVNVITDEFMSILKDMKNFCPHFHLSMQSGCNRILKLMNRHYTKEEYLSKIELVRKYFPNASITTDVIVGFPTETEEDFKETVDTITKARFFEMHIFPYSKRDGTVAAKMPQVNGAIKTTRIKILEEINKQNKEVYITQQTGILECFTEEVNDDYVTGHTENYIKVFLPKDTPIHKLLKVCNLEGYKDGAKAKLVNNGD